MNEKKIQKTRLRIKNLIKKYTQKIEFKEHQDNNRYGCSCGAR